MTAMVTAVLACCALLTGCGPDFDGLPRLRIAAGNTGGVYDQLAQPLATAWARDLGIERPEVQQTGGSPENVDRLLAGKADVAFAAADVAADRAAKNPDRLCTLARIHDDYLHVVVRADSAIRSVADLRGHRIAVGSPESGVAYIANRLLEVAGLSTDNVRQLGLTASLDALVRGDIDAFFWSGGLPTPAIARRTQTAGLRLLDIAGLLPPMHERSAVYGTATIPATTYNQQGPVTTLVVPNFLVVPSSMSGDVAKALVRSLFDARSQLAEANSAALSIDVHPGIETAPLPLHPGALRYYRDLKP
ncbi:TAXI family TRAP transporter solute-binding subunit [Amycolatopsis sp. NPDC059021]|uniref:TAXI family TRAP transporter solute-binding subunit n=1 Tax=Amycolatopsis sp. NPDC059021 TaxID=3346704 RepID=UPI0036734D04